MVTLVTTLAGDLLIAAGGFAGLVTPRVDLITAISPDPNRATVWGDITVPTYTGYPGPVTVTISAAYVSHPSGKVAVDISDAAFNGPSAGAGVDVIGVVFHDNGGTPVVYAVGLFDGPLALQVSTDRVTVDETMLLNTSAVGEAAN